MPTKETLISAAALLGATAFVGLSATPAMAGCNGPNCAVPVQVVPSYAPEFGPMTVRTAQPMGHLRSVQFQRAPNVSITRVHGMGPTASLSDAPSGFSNGCHPTSTTYCRSDQGRPVTVEMAPQLPPAPQPVPLALYSPPAPIAAPVPSEPRVVRIGGGYDPSKFTPRVYGDPTFVPGIAHIPTSIVDRDPGRAQAALDSGRAEPQPLANGGQVPNPAMMRQSAPQGLPMGGLSTQSVPYGVTLPDTHIGQRAYSVTLPDTYSSRPAMGMSTPQMQAPQMMMGQPMMRQPMMRQPMMARQMQAPGLTNSQGLGLAPTRFGPSYGQPGAPLLQRSGPMAGTYGSRVAQDGTYWEKVSGPTAFGDTIATQVICKRKLPTQVVNPVIGVPVPVPVPVPGCETGQSHAHQSHAHGGRQQGGQRYIDPERARWFR